MYLLKSQCDKNFKKEGTLLKEVYNIKWYKWTECKLLIRARGMAMDYNPYGERDIHKHTGTDFRLCLCVCAHICSSTCVPNDSGSAQMWSLFRLWLLCFQNPRVPSFHVVLHSVNTVLLRLTRLNPSCSPSFFFLINRTASKCSRILVDGRAIESKIIRGNYSNYFN